MPERRKTVLITGCSSGIGRALALEFHAQGLEVFATARNPTALQELVDQGIHGIQLDVTDPQSVHHAREQVSALVDGKLDILVNNAGQTLKSSAIEADISAVEAVYAVNVFGVMRVVKEFANLVIASGDGRIVQVGSVGGISPFPFRSAYGSSKAALHAFNNTLRVELAPFNVKVINICTGYIKTDLSKGALLEFSSDSLYKPIEAEAKKASAPNPAIMPPGVWAQQVVKDVLRPKPAAWYWRGTRALSVWFIDTFFKRTTFDSIVAKSYGLLRLAEIVRSRGKVIGSD